MRFGGFWLWCLLCSLYCGWLLCAGCKPADYRRDADAVAYRIIEQKQMEALGRTDPFTVEPAADALRRRLIEAQLLPYSSPASFGTEDLEQIEHWPEKDYPRAVPAGNEPMPIPASGPLRLSLLDALQIAARNSRDYQKRKEDVFREALDLDLERDDFRNTWAGAIDTLYQTDLSGSSVEGGVEQSSDLSWTRTLETGAVLTGRIAADLVKLCTMDRASSLGIVADATISIPLLRGSGRHIVTEPLRQAQRDVIYAVYTFERFKRTFAVLVASEYLSVLQRLDRIRNTEDNYRRLKIGARRARRMADAGRLPEIQVDQTRQDELRARERWIAAQEAYARGLDSFKITLGLSTDAEIELDYEELTRLGESAKEVIGDLNNSPANDSTDRGAADPATTAPAEVQIELDPPSRQGGGPLELDPAAAVRIALDSRLDLRTAIGRVYDAQRDIVVAADNLRAELTILGTAGMGEGRSLSSAGSEHAQLRPERGVYSAAMLLDLPLERTSERNQYRDSFIVLERVVRSVQELEDQVKFDVRDELRKLVLARESIKIQAQSVRLAGRRVASTALLLQAGRAETRDVLESQEALVSSQNALSTALVSYRVSELQLQRDMGVLEVNEKGLWREYRPEDFE